MNSNTNTNTNTNIIECSICMEQIELLDQLYVYPNGNKLKFCFDCVSYMIKNNFSRYINEISHADCESSLKSALKEQIPLFITIDSLKKSEQIKQIKFRNKIFDSKLIKPISDESLNNLNKQFAQIVKQINLDSTGQFDYLGEIIKILHNYNLDSVDKLDKIK